MELEERISRAELDIRACHEDIRACKIAIHHLKKAIDSVAEAVSTNTETLSALAETQEKLFTIVKNHQVTISNLIKNPKAKKKFNKEAGGFYI